MTVSSKRHLGKPRELCSTAESANAHLPRPAENTDSLEWSVVGYDTDAGNQIQSSENKQHSSLPSHSSAPYIKLLMRKDLLLPIGRLFSLVLQLLCFFLSSLFHFTKCFEQVSFPPSLFLIFLDLGFCGYHVFYIKHYMTL